MPVWMCKVLCVSLSLCTRRRTELVGTLSNQQIWGEQEPNVKMPSAEEEIAENDINSPKQIRTQWTPLSRAKLSLLVIVSLDTLALYSFSSKYSSQYYIILAILKLQLPFIFPIYFHFSSIIIRISHIMTYNDVVKTWCSVMKAITSVAENHAERFWAEFFCSSCVDASSSWTTIRFFRITWSISGAQLWLQGSDMNALSTGKHTWPPVVGAAPLIHAINFVLTHFCLLLSGFVVHPSKIKRA